MRRTSLVLIGMVALAVALWLTTLGSVRGLTSQVFAGLPGLDEVRAALGFEQSERRLALDLMLCPGQVAAAEAHGPTPQPCGTGAAPSLARTVLGDSQQVAGWRGDLIEARHRLTSAGIPRVHELPGPLVGVWALALILGLRRVPAAAERASGGVTR